MKSRVFKTLLMMSLLMASMVAHGAPRVLTAVVTDTKGEPLEFVNVVLLSLPDSIFVGGAVTDANGGFTLSTDSQSSLLRLTSIGYETLYLDIERFNESHIQLHEESVLLGEVVVRSQLPKTLVKGEALRTTVAGTILENAGTASDALSKIPSLEAERDGAVKVIGRGDAEVYINGRRVQDIKELSRLRSDQIQHVDVIQNPGARYAATTKAVVRISLKKAQGEGFSFQDYASAMYQYGFTITNDISVNYRIGGLDVTAAFWAGRYGHSKSLQDNNLIYNVGPQHIVGLTRQERKIVWKGWSPQLQVNYMINENHSFGAFYKYDRHPTTDNTGWINTDTYIDDVFSERSESYIMIGDGFSKHIFNAYYNGKVGQLGIDWNIDGLSDDTTSPNQTTEQTTMADGATDSRTILSQTNSGNKFWATKLILSYPLWTGNVSLGGEYGYNRRTDAYNYTASEAVPVQATDNLIKERSAAAFVEYGRRFGKMFAQVGVRYEHLSNDYYNFGIKETEVCRKYGDWFPTAVLSMPVGKVQLSLSYRRDIERPHYSSLSNSTIYINHYTYQSGNPYLRPQYTHNLVFNAAYKWINGTINYSHIKDATTMSTEPFPGAEDPLVSLVRPINSTKAYNQLMLFGALQPVIGCWHPRWNAVIIFQDYQSPTANGGIITLNHPLAGITWQNDIELPHNWRLSANASWQSKGDKNNFRVTRTMFHSSIGIQHDFNLGRAGTLTIDARCYDLFNTSKSGATIYGLREITSYNPARRTFFLDLTWKFNEAQSKYRGSGAGDKQKARM